MTTKTSERDRGRVARRLTLAQRRVLLQRIRDEVAGVVEDIEATAASLRSVRPTGKQATPTEQAAVRLIRAEQHRQQMELSRLYAEYESLAFRRTSTRSALNTAA